MRKYLLAAAAVAAIASPAMARDKTGYVGISAGPMIAEDISLDVTSNGTLFKDYAMGDHKVGYDVDANAGYDFGAIRAELEVAYKRAAHEAYTINGSRVPGDGSTKSLSIMANALLDFGDDDGWQGFLGGGVGLARTKVNLSAAGFSGRFLKDSGFAYQVLAGVRHPVATNVDFGLKYRFYNHDIDDAVSFAPLTTVAGDADSRFRSHSLLASLTYNFGAAPPPPPPPPPAEPAPPPPPPPPATQTCPDGSVILATDVCPAPPPPPPPPPPAPERG
ncbi:hypothetical protein GCM10022281_25900 [Sphingomonas rosea]|uniref:Outer membrane protein beta-barrel domain-containing protein n=1 Tax=Sphingomonas rosea TaxID=335605 RepID=A0ABP7UHL5_9SPHN